MINKILIPFLFLLFACCPAFHDLVAQPVKSYDCCYEKNEGIFVFSSKEKQEMKVGIKGSWPNLSPDGTRIAYTASTTAGDRSIKIYNILTNSEKVLKVNSPHCFNPVWSPQGQMVAYSVLYPGGGYDWGIAVIDTANRMPIDIIKPVAGAGTGFFAPSWLADGSGIVAHTMDSMFVFDLQGKRVRQFRIPEFVGSSDARCLMTPDGKRLIFDTSVDDPNSWGFNDPVSAIFVFDIASGTSNRITPVGYHCLSPVLQGERIYFEGYAPGRKTRDIFSIDREGKDLRTEFKGCWSFSGNKFSLNTHQD